MSKINTYEELVAERRRLEAELQTQKAYVNGKLNGIKDRLEPVGKVISFLGGFKKNNTSSSLLKLGTTVGIDLLVGQKLKKAGWLTRLALPFIMKFTAAKTIDKVSQKAVAKS